MTNRSRALITAVLMLAGAFAASGAQAQQASSQLDSRWSAWLGCWTPAARRGTETDMQLCMVPSADNRGVVRMTFAGDKEVLSETVVADGNPLTSPENGCVGTRQSRWSQSGTRIFVASSLKCPSRPDVSTTGMSALVTADQWLDVQVVKSGSGQEQTRTQRFWRSSTPAPAPIAAQVSDLRVAKSTVPPVTIDDVIEASSHTASNGVEAWLSESNSRVPVDRHALVRLADNRVSGNVIDLMVALAYPKKFEVRRSSPSGGGGGGGFFGGDQIESYPGYWSDLAGYGLGYGAWGVPYFFGSTYYPYNGAYYYLPATGGSGSVGDESETHGQVVNGQGYTRVQPREAYRGTASSSGGGAQGYSTSGGADSGSSGGSSGSSSGASPGGYSGGGGSDTGLTAVPR